MAIFGEQFSYNQWFDSQERFFASFVRFPQSTEAVFLAASAGLCCDVSSTSLVSVWYNNIPYLIRVDHALPVDKSSGIALGIRIRLPYHGFTVKRNVRDE